MERSGVIGGLKEVRCNIHGSKHQHYLKLITYGYIFPATPFRLCNGKVTPFCHGNNFMRFSLRSLDSDISRTISGLQAGLHFHPNISYRRGCRKTIFPEKQYKKKTYYENKTLPYTLLLHFKPRSSMPVLRQTLRRESFPYLRFFLLSGLFLLPCFVLLELSNPSFLSSFFLFFLIFFCISRKA